mgnify:CR=1 FL=1
MKKIGDILVLSGGSLLFLCIGSYFLSELFNFVFLCDNNAIGDHVVCEVPFPFIEKIISLLAGVSLLVFFVGLPALALIIIGLIFIGVSGFIKKRN